MFVAPFNWARARLSVFTRNVGADRPVRTSTGRPSAEINVRTREPAPTLLAKGTRKVVTKEETNEIHDLDLRLAAGLRRDDREGQRQNGVVGEGLRRDGRLHGGV